MAIAGTDSAARSTRQRSAVAALMGEIEEFRSAQQVHDLLRQRGERIGLTTVYRSLQILASAGKIDCLRTPDGEVSYRRCSSGHHHHLVCQTCGHAVEFDLPSVERIAAQVARDNGFSDISHTLEVFGTCTSCATA